MKNVWNEILSFFQQFLSIGRERVGHGYASETMAAAILEMHERKLSENTGSLDYKTGDDTATKLPIPCSEKMEWNCKWCSVIFFKLIPWKIRPFYFLKWSHHANTRPSARQKCTVTWNQNFWRSVKTHLRNVWWTAYRTRKRIEWQYEIIQHRLQSWISIYRTTSNKIQTLKIQAHWKLREIKILIIMSVSGPNDYLFQTKLNYLYNCKFALLYSKTLWNTNTLHTASDVVH